MPTTRRSSAASGSSSLNNTPDGPPLVEGPNTRRSSLRKRPSPGSFSETLRRKITKEAVPMVSPAEEDDDVEVFLPGAEEHGGSSHRRCSRSTDVPRKRSGCERPSVPQSTSKSQRKEGQKAGKETVVPAVDEVASEEEFFEVEEDVAGFEEEGNGEESEGRKDVLDAVPKRRVGAMRKSAEGEDADCSFIGQPINEKEAKKRWPKRYQGKASKGKKKVIQVNGSKVGADDKEVIQAKCHFTEAKVDGVIFKLHDDAYVEAGDGEDDYICNIIELFEAVDGCLYFRAQWFYRACDTVIKQLSNLIDEKRVFLSEICDDNPLDCLVKKLKIIRLPLNASAEEKQTKLHGCDYYCDTMYLLPYSTFKNLPSGCEIDSLESASTISSEFSDIAPSNGEVNSSTSMNDEKAEMRVLDIYSGCGAMSTGLSLGANFAGSNLSTKWAVDLNEYACESLKLNHQETEVRNETADNFLCVLRDWRRLCKTFGLVENDGSEPLFDELLEVGDDEDDEDSDDECGENEVDNEKIFEVERLLAIRHGDPEDRKKRGLYFKVAWKGYGEDEHSWEPMNGLKNSPLRIKEFVLHGYNSHILPLPGDVDVICGGPPCQGISGFNRFRDKNNPLADEKNKQLVVFMEIVEYLKPRFVLMENVVDLLKFASGYLGRYALARLVGMNYQTRMGMMAAGAYGLAQFRMRVFLWGALPTEKLPQFPLPTHDVVNRGVVPLEFEMHTVAYDEGQEHQLEKKLLLEDAISDLPAVDTYEKRDEMPYDKDPKTEFQRFIRLSKEEMMGFPAKTTSKRLLYDHRPLALNDDDYERVCRIPKKKGANFRDLPGVHVRPDNKVEWDPDVPRVCLKSGKPLVPDYAMSFVDGRSTKPFGRLWWDQTVPTVVTRAEPHNQAILHPEQDRVLSIRENARLQGFPDYYKLCGPIKQRYIQVGNAVAVPVGRALGYALAGALQKNCGEEPLLKLPADYIRVGDPVGSASSDDNQYDS
ncbi:hypothetical protein MLD38_025394 [Melastoma candidum]|uniref:Uncharacterized protein n=1 Tax=Melastoma candidum TaxID=119954 RepID=A0ACB9NUX9_9MYRT|nr:hypothetical protein MLD38_025394 [Melastoma candidum]